MFEMQSQGQDLMMKPTSLGLSGSRKTQGVYSCQEGNQARPQTSWKQEKMVGGKGDV